MDIFNFLLNGVQNANKQSSWQAKQSVSMPELILASSPSCSSCMNCTPHVHTPFAHHGHTTPPFSPLAPTHKTKSLPNLKPRAIYSVGSFPLPPSWSRWIWLFPQPFSLFAHSFNVCQCAVYMYVAWWGIDICESQAPKIENW